MVIVALEKELNREKSNEIDTINREHQRQIQLIAEDRRKEIDVSRTMAYNFPLSCSLILECRTLMNGSKGGC